jgi:pimeloyl-ACP methyl ester carboxylesterase
MKTIILVHGSWHWHKVIPQITKAGHKAIAIDLPGMGIDNTPIKKVTLDMSVESLVKMIDSIEGQVILVAHSKNGIIISQAAEYRSHKIEKLVYIAAFLVPNGKTQMEYANQDKQSLLRPFVKMNADLNAHQLMPEIYKDGLYADCEDSIIELANSLLCYEPLGTALTPLRLSDEKYGTVPRYYIECTEDRAVSSSIQKIMYTESPCKKVFSMASSHSPFFSKPIELSNLLLEIARD